MIPVTYRSATMADAAALARLRSVIRETTGHGRPATEQDVIREFTAYATPEAFLLAEVDGDLVGWGFAAPNGDGGRSFLGGGVLPEYQGQGIGRHLLGWQLDQFGPTGLPIVSCRSTDQATQALLRRFGLVLERGFLWMTRDVALPTVPATTDLRIAAYAPGDDHALWVAHQEGFGEHFGFHPTPFEEWADRFPRDERFRPDLSYAAWDGDDLVAFALCYVPSVTPEPAKTVVIEQVATRTPWRGRGAAGALLATVIDAARAAGVPELALNVDGENPTGAIRIYEKAGFVESFRRLQFSRPQ
ncbi:MAG: GNAT family N-acetyltransferase [Hamadaea sp.]|nr:GNAT family N-acetyltransferase [Hamadaea sp.]